MCRCQDEKKKNDCGTYTDHAKQDLQEPEEGRNGYQPSCASNQNPEKQDHEKNEGEKEHKLRTAMCHSGSFGISPKSVHLFHYIILIIGKSVLRIEKGKNHRVIRGTASFSICLDIITDAIHMNDLYTIL